MNRLASATKQGAANTYQYGPLGRRTAKETAGLTTNYIYDGDHAAVEYDNSGTLVRKFIYGPGIDQPLVMVRRGDAPGVEIKYYYHADALGSIAGLTNSTGAWQETYSYSAWGKLNGSSSVGNPYFYTGRRYDAETGLYYYRARYYDAYLRRFIQPDPIGFEGGMNWYAYVGNSPVNYVDPYGEAGALISLIVEGAFLVYDTFDLHKTLTDPSVTQFDRDVAIGCYFASMSLPLGGYNTGYRTGKKFLNKARNNLPGRKGAFRKAKRDAGINMNQHPEDIQKAPMRSAPHEGGHVIKDSDGNVIYTREYHYTNKDGQKVIIQDHSAGHTKGNQGPHFNVRPADNPRTGALSGTQDHYPFRK